MEKKKTASTRLPTNKQLSKKKKKRVKIGFV